MTYKEILKKGTAELIKEQLNNGKSYTEATVIVKKQIISAREEAWNDVNYHNVNVQAWGDGDGDEGLRAQYGSYDAMVDQKKQAELAISNLGALKVGLQTNYKLKCMQTIQDLPKQGAREDNADYIKKLEVYIANLNDIQDEARNVVAWAGRLSTLQAQGYDYDDKSDYLLYRKNIAECVEQLDNLPYTDLGAAQEILQEAVIGIKKANDKKVELQGAFGN